MTYTFPYNGQTIVSRVSKSCYVKRIKAGYTHQRAATEPATTTQQAGQKAAKVFGGNPHKKYAKRGIEREEKRAIDPAAAKDYLSKFAIGRQGAFAAEMAQALLAHIDRLEVVAEGRNAG